MLIAFVHNGKAFLPEIEAYTNFFFTRGIASEEVSPRQLDKLQANVVWHFMGNDFTRRKNITTVHEYVSASTPPFPDLKNRIKGRFNVQPHFRLFLNQYVKEKFNFHDNIPYGFRDMGVDMTTVNEKYTETKKEYDFIYTGDISPARHLPDLLNCFTHGSLQEKLILILARNYEHLSNKFGQYHNIRFAGPVPYREVKQYIRRARFGINYIPDKEPFNQQTSSKLLEYIANRVPVITTTYSWVQQFEKNFGGRFYYLNNDLSNFTWENVNHFDYSFADLSTWTWEYQIKRSGILEFLQSRLSGIRS